MKATVTYMKLHPDMAPRTKAIDITFIAETPEDRKFIKSISQLPVEETGGPVVDSTIIPHDFKQFEVSLNF